MMTGDRETRIEKIRDLVYEWLTDDGFTIDPEGFGSQSFSWGFTATNERGVQVTVAQRIQDEDRIFIRIGMLISEESQRTLGRLSPRDREDFRSEMRARLSQMNIVYEGVRDPFVKIEIGQELYYDGFTKDRFFQRLRLVTNGFLLVAELITRKLTELQARDLH